MTSKNTRDIHRVVRENSGRRPEEWMAKEEISYETMDDISQSWMLGLSTLANEKGEVDDSTVQNALMAAFMIGWECGRELGRR